MLLVLICFGVSFVLVFLYCIVLVFVGSCLMIGCFCLCVCVGLVGGWKLLGWV